MKTSKYIKHIAKTNILKKKQRTWLSIVAVCLSTAIIFTSLTLFKNIFDFSKNTDYQAIGNYHYATYAQDKSDDLFSRYTKSLDSDTGYYGTYQNYAINLRSLHIENNENAPLPFVLQDGTFPTNENEIMVSDRLGLKVGEELSLSLGSLDYKSEQKNLYHFPVDITSYTPLTTQKHTYQVVGVYYQNEQFLKTTNGLECVYTLYPTSDQGVYYVKDAQIHLNDSYAYFLDKMDVHDQYVLTNTDVISTDSIKNFLQDTTILLIIFIVIAVIGMSMSLISVHNVILISDKDRKKELGLLKSIGATPKEVQRLLQIELLALGLCGAILGIILGITVSYFVLNLFIERIYVTFQWSMVFQPLLLVISLIGGIALMYISGMKAYRQYIYSSPISDLKNFSYEYGQPIKPKTTRRKSFAWRMFIIYNGRMKRQTKNIFRSFFLFLSTTVLFVSILLSNIIYENKYTSREYDFDVTNYHEVIDEKGGLQDVDPAFTYDLYRKVDEKIITANYIYAYRLPNIVGYFWTDKALYNNDQISYYRSLSPLNLQTVEVVQPDQSVKEYCNLYHSPVVLDDVQLKEIEPYLIDGSLEHLSSNDIVAIYDDSKQLGSYLGANLKVGDSVFFGPQSPDTEFKVAAIVYIPTDALFNVGGQSNLHFNYSEYPRIFAFSLNSYVEAGKSNQVNEHIYIDLVNNSNASEVQDEVIQSMSATGNTENYVCNSIALIIETNRFATFIIEVLLYPLFLMLFIVSLMNINNVFVGNVHLKRNDISIMKSVGMTGSQLNTLFTFEYIEGYVNAAGIVVVLFIVLALLENYLQIASSFDFAANILGTLMLSILLLGTMLVAPLVILSLKKISKILPIENLKDVD